MNPTHELVFLVDVDDTLLENDRIQDDLKRYMDREFGAECRDRFWAIQEDLFKELGYRDYLGALQRFRVEHPYDPRLVSATSYLLDYPFADRLYPGALDVLEKFRTWGQTVILSDGDVVFQPRWFWGGLLELRISSDKVTEQLEDGGVDEYIKPLDNLMQTRVNVVRK